MTDIYVELGGKKAIAWSLEWPGWCRIRTSEEEAVQALIDTESRYRPNTYIDDTRGKIVI